MPRESVDLVEAALFAFPVADALRLAGYADIPEDAYVNLMRFPSFASLRELAALLGCDPALSLREVQSVPAEGARVLTTGAGFEQALQTRSFDELERPAIAWARTEAWRGLEPNVMDVVGAVTTLAAHWRTAAGQGRSLCMWVTDVT